MRIWVILQLQFCRRWSQQQRQEQYQPRTWKQWTWRYPCWLQGWQKTSFCMKKDAAAVEDLSTEDNNLTIHSPQFKLYSVLTAVSVAYTHYFVQNDKFKVCYIGLLMSHLPNNFSKSSLRPDRSFCKVLMTTSKMHFWKRNMVKTKAKVLSKFKQIWGWFKRFAMTILKMTQGFDKEKFELIKLHLESSI